jgi:DNA mismatch repair ATPase MutS
MMKYRALSKKAELVKKYSELLFLLEKEKFSSPEMTQLRSTLDGRHGLPSGSTRKLSAILNAFDARNNLIVGYLLNFFILWDFIQVRRLERWQARHRDQLPKWLDALAHADALCSLANFRFNNPDSVFPEVKEGDYLINAEDLGHPLIPSENRTNNPIILLCRRHFTIVSGANMAGKSTYLRTVGVNMVLAMAGSAVIAGKMTFAPVSLVTSIRTRDSLQKNESYFYAELKRLKVIMERLEQGERLLILLDEILKGTNSRDKQSGSFALLEKLLRFDACGLVATHDLALGELEKTYPGNISNKSFEVVIENDALVFDYKLKDGIARQMNATYLMRKMGITD